MWTRIGIPMLILALAAVSAGTALALHEGSSGTMEQKRYVDPGKPPLPEANGVSVWNYITVLKPYTRWPRWPDKGKFYEGKHPHGALLTTYVSRDAKKIIKKKRGKFANGAFIVKENYTPDKTLGAVTVMYKVDGYNPEAGDWFWVKYKPDGVVEKEGKVDGCINCHRDRSGNDWVFTGDVGK